ncbi:MAG: hypothetical protein ACI4AK_06795 [Lepagella sp.]
MMKKILLLLLCMIPTIVGYAQLPKWMIFPTNDTLYVAVDNKIIQAIEDGKTSLWSMDGKMLYSTPDQIMPFKDDVATIVNNNGKIVGVVDLKGNFTELPNLGIVYENPYFEDGYLLCDDKGVLTYYQQDGNKAWMSYYYKTYPFHNGYAPYITYSEILKQKDPHYAYHKKDGKILEYTYKDKDEIKKLDPKNIEFLSGIANNGKGVAVINQKLYWFIPETETFEPFLWGNEENPKKRHLATDRDYKQYFLNAPTDSLVIIAKYGNKQQARLVFDRELMPKVFNFDDGNLTFGTEPKKGASYKTDLTIIGKESFGFNFKNYKILPEQFQEVGLMYDNKAFVKINDKWGVIEILQDENLKITINKGEDVAFRHQKFNTQIRLDLPAAISAKEARINISEETGCNIDKTSRETKDTESGNFVTYDCALTIPSSLPDTITSITYFPISISYDNIALLDMPISIKAWHLKYYNVDPIESETSISNGIANFTLNINAQKNGNEDDYPFDVKIDADNINVSYEKLSETRYKCIVSNLNEGINNLNILVTEKGCPPSIFPFEIYYSKPVPKKKKKEEVIIRKKAPHLNV